MLYTKNSKSSFLELWVEGVATCRIPVPWDYEVKDMKVYGNLLYFCGKQNSCGFIAVANLHDMYMHATSVGTPPTSAAVSYNCLDPRCVSSLEKLVVYGEENGPMTLPINYANEHIAAVGKGGTWINTGCVAVHIKYDSLPMVPLPIYSPSILTVSVIEDLTSTINEPLPEVLLTDDYVAFARYRYGTDEYVIHRCGKYNMVGTYGTARRYAAPNDEVIFNLEGETLEGNNIALATCSLADMYYNNYEIRVRNIDLSTWNMVNSQYIPVDDTKQDDLAMVYNRNKQKLVSSLHYQLPNLGGYDYGLIEIDPWYSFTGTSYYSSDAILDPNHRIFIPMDQTFGVHFVAMDKNGWLRKSLPMNSGNNETCFNLRGFTIYVMSPLTGVSDNISWTDYWSQYEIVPQQAAISDITTDIECIITE